MVKVNRKIGAVAVYSPLRAGALVLVVAALLIAGGYAAAQLADDDADGSTATPVATAAPVRTDGLQTRLDASEARTERVLARLRRVRAQRLKYAKRIQRMRRARRTANAGAARLQTGRPYIVVLRKGSRNADYVIGPRSALERGMSYRRCPDGGGICARRDGP